MDKEKLMDTLYDLEDRLEYNETKEGLILGVLINELQNLKITFEKLY